MRAALSAAPSGHPSRARTAFRRRFLADETLVPKDEARRPRNTELPHLVGRISRQREERDPVGSHGEERADRAQRLPLRELAGLRNIARLREQFQGTSGWRR